MGNFQDQFFSWIQTNSGNFQKTQAPLRESLGQLGWNDLSVLFLFGFLYDCSLLSF